MENEVLKLEEEIPKEDALLLAAEKGDEDVVALLINAGADIHYSHYENEYTALHYASKNGWASIVHSLLQKGADIEVLTEDGDSSLLLAARQKHASVVDLLIKAGANIHGHDRKYKFTMLHYAAINGWAEMVLSLLEQGVNIEAKGVYGDTPLHMAARTRRLNIVEILLNAGADVKCYDRKYKFSLLHYASKNGWPEIVRTALEKGGDIELPAFNGDTAILFAAIDKYESIVEFLINAGANIHCVDRKYRFTVLHYASKHGWLEIVRTVLQKGADIEQKAFNSDTPILLAARERNEGIVRLLMDAGANVKCCSWNNYSMLHFAARNGWSEILQLLLEKGVDMEIQNAKGETAMLLAAKIGRRDIAQLLLDAGADTDVNCSDINSRFNTLLYFASLDGWLEMAQLILQKSAALHVKTRSAKVSLVRTASVGDIALVDLLLNAGVDIDSPDTELNSFTPLHVSAVCGEFETVRFLLKKGANINSKCSRGRTSLQYACEYYKAEVVELLIRAGADVNDDFNYVKSLLADIITLIHSNSDVKLVGTLLFKGRGAYIKTVDYEKMLESSFLTEHILQDSEFCSQSVINEFNIKDLPELYKLLVVCETLPGIEHMRIGSKCQVAKEALLCAKHEIQVKGHYNVLEARPIALKLLCVRSFLAYCSSVKEQISFNRTKRSAASDSDNPQSPNKVLRYN